MARITSQRAYEDANELNLKRSVKVAELAQVIEFYPDAMRADVKPLVKYPDGNNYLSCPPILSVPVLCTFGSDGTPYCAEWRKGDIGLIVYLDRDSDGVLISGGESAPNTERVHSGDDAVLIGGVPTGRTGSTGGNNNSGT